MKISSDLGSDFPTSHLQIPAYGNGGLEKLWWTRKLKNKFNKWTRSSQQWSGLIRTDWIKDARCLIRFRRVSYSPETLENSRAMKPHADVDPSAKPGTDGQITRSVFELHLKIEQNFKNITTISSWTWDAGRKRSWNQLLSKIFNAISCTATSTFQFSKQRIKSQKYVRR